MHNDAKKAGRHSTFLVGRWVQFLWRDQCFDVWHGHIFSGVITRHLWPFIRFSLLLHRSVDFFPSSCLPSRGAPSETQHKQKIGLGVTSRYDVGVCGHIILWISVDLGVVRLCHLTRGGVGMNHPSAQATVCLHSCLVRLVVRQKPSKTPSRPPITSHTRAVAVCSRIGRIHASCASHCPSHRLPTRSAEGSTHISERASSTQGEPHRHIV